MTEWGLRRPGEVAMSADDDGAVLYLGEPDWVRLPPSAGAQTGAAVRVLAVEGRPCVAPGHRHAAKHYVLEGDLQVCECLEDALFYWYTLKPKG